MTPPRYLRRGEVVRASITGIGAMEQVCVEPGEGGFGSRSAPWDATSSDPSVCPLPLEEIDPIASFGYQSRLAIPSAYASDMPDR